jgi:hypothetical protein
VRRSHITFIVKLIIGVGLLVALLLIDDNWRNVADIARETQSVYLLPFVGIVVVMFWVSCLKWRLFLRGHAADLPMRRLMTLYVIGYFFNNFLPSNVGGDAVRSYMLGRHIESQGRAFSTVFLERFAGLLAMVSMAVGAYLLSPALRTEPLIRWSIILMGGATAGIALVIWRPTIVTKMLTPFRAFESVESMITKLVRVHGYVSHFRDEKMVLVRAMGYSYVFYLLAAINVYIGGLLLGVQSSLPQLFVVTPIVMLIAAVPITLNGLGTREWAFSVYLASAGTTPEQGLAIALALRAQTIFLSAVGGILFLVDSSRNRVETPPADVSPSDVSPPDVPLTDEAEPQTAPVKGVPCGE